MRINLSFNCPLFNNTELHPSVLAAFKPGVVRGYGSGPSIAFGGQPVAADASVDEIIDYNLGAGL